MMHLLTPWYRPSWQGGDTQQPLCHKPRIGLSSEEAVRMPMSAEAEDVSCPLCLHAMHARRSYSAGFAALSAAAQAPPRRKNNDLKHCRAVWAASKGRMFPFLVFPAPARLAEREGQAA